MSDLSSYRDKAANYGKLANQAEQEKDYAGAFEYYTKALDIFSHMIKCKFQTNKKDSALNKSASIGCEADKIYLRIHIQSGFLKCCNIDEKNPKLIEIYKRKAEEYFERAAYLKKQVIQPEKDVSQGGGSAAAQKPK